MAVVTVCAGQIIIDGSGAPTCSTGWQLVQYEQVVPFDVSQLDPAILGAAFGAGFFVMVPVWAACIGARFLLNMVK